ncbi:MAG TPA: hypothetical protein VN228_00045 [Pyrinomonadaceae bacterium]|nr:hypothetical protein [Pyrinomonadaceae bacterium]
MRAHKSTLRLVIFTGVVTVITAAATLGTGTNAPLHSGERAQNERQQEENYRRRKERERRFPEVDYEAPEPADAETKAERKLKNTPYDKFNFAIRDPSPHVGETSVQTEWDFHVEAPPAGQSDSIVLGEVLSAAAHLSNDKTGIYSEFTVRIDEVIKGGDPSRLAPGLLIDVDRPGGIVRYSNGHRRLYSIREQNMPEAGRRYVLFLSTSGQSPNYRIITGYELTNGRVSPLDELSKVEVYRGMDEATFLKTVRDAAARAQ